MWYILSSSQFTEDMFDSLSWFCVIANSDEKDKRDWRRVETDQALDTTWDCALTPAGLKLKWRWYKGWIRQNSTTSPSNWREEFDKAQAKEI